MASTSVVFPWSTWATMATLRMSPRVCMGMGQFSQQLRALLTTLGRARLGEPFSPSAHQLGHRRDDPEVGRKPAHVIQRALGEQPQLVVVLEGARLALRTTTSCGCSPRASCMT